MRIDKGQKKTIDNADRVTIQKKNLYRCAVLLITFSKNFVRRKRLKDSYCLLQFFYQIYDLTVPLITLFKMNFENYENDNEVFADNLSAHSDEDLPEFDSESDFSDNEIFVRRRNRVLPLQFSNSESEDEEIAEWSDTDNGSVYYIRSSILF